MKGLLFTTLKQRISFNQEILLKIFNRIDSLLNIKMTLTIYGGSLMTMLYKNRTATCDIDCTYNNSHKLEFDNILEAVKSEYQLEDNWINTEVSKPLSYLKKEDKEEFLTLNNLKILRPSNEQMLAMKVLASRVEPAKDFIDAYLLCKTLDIKSRVDLMEIVNHYICDDYIGQRQLQFIKYLGYDLGYNW